MDSALTQVTAIVGSVTGVAGLCISAINFLLDRDRLSLAAYRERTLPDSSDAAETETVAVLIANSGKRPVIVVSVAAIGKDGRTLTAGPGYSFAAPQSNERLPQILNPPHYIVVRLPSSGTQRQELAAIEVMDSLNRKYCVPRSYVQQLSQDAREAGA